MQVRFFWSLTNRTQSYRKALASPARFLGTREEMPLRSRMHIRRSKVFVSKSEHTSIRRPRGSTTASPQLGPCCVGDVLAANSTGTNPPTEEAALLFLFQRYFFR